MSPEFRVPGIPQCPRNSRPTFSTASTYCGRSALMKGSNLKKGSMAMKRPVLLSAMLLPACVTANADRSASSNPLVGTWKLERYVDTPEGGTPIHTFGDPPIGLFVFTSDGHVSIHLMRNPPAPEAPSNDPDPDACTPAWYCSYFGTYTYDPKGPSWTTHVTGGNILSYSGTDQKRSFRIEGDLLTISETYTSDGKTVRAERVLRRADR